MRVMVPLTAAITGATPARDDRGQPASVTSVDGLYPTSPIPWLFCSPMKARKSPMPAPEEIRTGLGISLANFARKPIAEIV